jgi:hypothetical protein
VFPDPINDSDNCWKENDLWGDIEDRFYFLKIGWKMWSQM